MSNAKTQWTLKDLFDKSGLPYDSVNNLQQSLKDQIIQESSIASNATLQDFSKAPMIKAMRTFNTVKDELLGTKIEQSDIQKFLKDTGRTRLSKEKISGYAKPKSHLEMEKQIEELESQVQKLPKSSNQDRPKYNHGSLSGRNPQNPTLQTPPPEDTNKPKNDGIDDKQDSKDAPKPIIKKVDDSADLARAKRGLARESITKEEANLGVDTAIATLEHSFSSKMAQFALDKFGGEESLRAPKEDAFLQELPKLVDFAQTMAQMNSDYHMINEKSTLEKDELLSKEAQNILSDIPKAGGLENVIIDPANHDIFMKLRGTIAQYKEREATKKYKEKKAQKLMASGTPPVKASLETTRRVNIPKLLKTLPSEIQDQIKKADGIKNVVMDGAHAELLQQITSFLGGESVRRIYKQINNPSGNSHSYEAIVVPGLESILGPEGHEKYTEIVQEIQEHREQADHPSTIPHDDALTFNDVEILLSDALSNLPESSPKPSLPHPMSSLSKALFNAELLPDEVLMKMHPDAKELIENLKAYNETFKTHNTLTQELKSPQLRTIPEGFKTSVAQTVAAQENAMHKFAKEFQNAKDSKLPISNRNHYTVRIQGAKAQVSLPDVSISEKEQKAIQKKVENLHQNAKEHKLQQSKAKHSEYDAKFAQKVAAVEQKQAAEKSEIERMRKVSKENAEIVSKNVYINVKKQENETDAQYDQRQLKHVEDLLHMEASYDKRVSEIELARLETELLNDENYTSFQASDNTSPEFLSSVQGVAHALHNAEQLLEKIVLKKEVLAKSSQYKYDMALKEISALKEIAAKSKSPVLSSKLQDIDHAAKLSALQSPAFRVYQDSNAKATHDSKTYDQLKQEIDKIEKDSSLTKLQINQASKKAYMNHFSEHENNIRQKVKEAIPEVNYKEIKAKEVDITDTSKKEVAKSANSMEQYLENRHQMLKDKLLNNIEPKFNSTVEEKDFENFALYLDEEYSKQKEDGKEIAESKEFVEALKKHAEEFYTALEEKHAQIEKEFAEKVQEYNKEVQQKNEEDIKIAEQINAESEVIYDTFLNHIMEARGISREEAIKVADNWDQDQAAHEAKKAAIQERNEKILKAREEAKKAKEEFLHKQEESIAQMVENIAPPKVSDTEAPTPQQDSAEASVAKPVTTEILPTELLNNPKELFNHMKNVVLTRKKANKDQLTKFHESGLTLEQFSSEENTSTKESTEESIADSKTFTPSSLSEKPKGYNFTDEQMEFRKDFDKKSTEYFTLMQEAEILTLQMEKIIAELDGNPEHDPMKISAQEEKILQREVAWEIVHDNNTLSKGLTRLMNSDDAEYKDKYNGVIPTEITSEVIEDIRDVSKKLLDNLKDKDPIAIEKEKAMLDKLPQQFSKTLATKTKKAKQHFLESKILSLPQNTTLPIDRKDSEKKNASNKDLHTPNDSLSLNTLKEKNASNKDLHTSNDSLSLNTLKEKNASNKDLHTPNDSLSPNTLKEHAEIIKTLSDESKIQELSDITLKLTNTLSVMNDAKHTAEESFVKAHKTQSFTKGEHKTSLDRLITTNEKLYQRKGEDGKKIPLKDPDSFLANKIKKARAKSKTLKEKHMENKELYTAALPSAIDRTNNALKLLLKNLDTHMEELETLNKALTNPSTGFSIGPQEDIAQYEEEMEQIKVKMEDVILAIVQLQDIRNIPFENDPSQYQDGFVVDSVEEAIEVFKDRTSKTDIAITKKLTEASELLNSSAENILQTAMLKHNAEAIHNMTEDFKNISESISEELKKVVERHSTITTEETQSIDEKSLEKPAVAEEIEDLAVDDKNIDKDSKQSTHLASQVKDLSKQFNDRKALLADRTKTLEYHAKEVDSSSSSKIPKIEFTPFQQAVKKLHELELTPSIPEKTINDVYKLEDLQKTSLLQLSKITGNKNYEEVLLSQHNGDKILQLYNGDPEYQTTFHDQHPPKQSDPESSKEKTTDKKTPTPIEHGEFTLKQSTDKKSMVSPSKYMVHTIDHSSIAQSASSQLVLEQTKEEAAQMTKYSKEVRDRIEQTKTIIDIKKQAKSSAKHVLPHLLALHDLETSKHEIEKEYALLNEMEENKEFIELLIHHSDVLIANEPERLERQKKISSMEKEMASIEEEYARNLNDMVKTDERVSKFQLEYDLAADKSKDQEHFSDLLKKAQEQYAKLDTLRNELDVKFANAHSKLEKMQTDFEKFESEINEIAHKEELEKALQSVDETMPNIAEEMSKFQITDDPKSTKYSVIKLVNDVENKKSTIKEKTAKLMDAVFTLNKEVKPTVDLLMENNKQIKKDIDEKYSHEKDSETKVMLEKMQENYFQPIITLSTEQILSPSKALGKDYHNLYTELLDNLKESKDNVNLYRDNKEFFDAMQAEEEKLNDSLHSIESMYKDSPSVKSTPKKSKAKNLQNKSSSIYLPSVDKSLNPYKKLSERKEDEKPPVAKEDEKPPVAKEDEKPPAAKEDEKPPVAKEDEKPPVAKEDEKPPVAKEDEKPPAAKEDEKPPAAKEDEKPPVAKEDEKPPAAKEDEKPPAAKEDEKPPVAKEDEKPPVAKEDEKPPAAKEDEKPPVAKEDEKPPAAKEDEKPPAAKEDEKPPVAKEDEKPPVAKEDEKPPAAKEDEKPPAAKEDEKPPVAKEDEKPPVAKEDEKPPVAKEDEKPPAAKEDEKPPVAKEDEKPPVAKEDEKPPVAKEDEKPPAAKEDEKPPVAKEDEKPPAAKEDEKPPVAKEDEKPPAASNITFNRPSIPKEFKHHKGNKPYTLRFGLSKSNSYLKVAKNILENAFTDMEANMKQSLDTGVKTSADNDLLFISSQIVAAKRIVEELSKEHVEHAVDKETEEKLREDVQKEWNDTISGWDDMREQFQQKYLDPQYNQNETTVKEDETTVKEDEKSPVADDTTTVKPTDDNETKPTEQTETTVQEDEKPPVADDTTTVKPTDDNETKPTEQTETTVKEDEKPPVAEDTSTVKPTDDNETKPTEQTETTVKEDEKPPVVEDTTTVKPTDDNETKPTEQTETTVKEDEKPPAAEDTTTVKPTDDNESTETSAAVQTISNISLENVSIDSQHALKSQNTYEAISTLSEENAPKDDSPANASDDAPKDDAPKDDSPTTASDDTPKDDAPKDDSPATASDDAPKEDSPATASDDAPKEDSSATASDDAPKEDSPATASDDAPKEDSSATASDDAPKEDSPATASNDASKDDAPKEDSSATASDDAPKDDSPTTASNDAPKEDSPTAASKEDSPTAASNDASKEDSPTAASNDASKEDSPTAASNDTEPKSLDKENNETVTVSEQLSNEALKEVDAITEKMLQENKTNVEIDNDYNGLTANIVAPSQVEGSAPEAGLSVQQAS